MQKDQGCYQANSIARHNDDVELVMSAALNAETKASLVAE